MLNLSTLTWRVVVLAGLVLAAFVIMSLSGVDTSQLVTLLVALITGGGLMTHQAARADKQDQALEQITHQTNGALTRRIETITTRVIRSELRKVGHDIPHDPHLDD